MAATSGSEPHYDVVVPTIGRPCLADLLADLAVPDPAREAVIVVDDRRAADGPLAVGAGVEVVAGGGRGPAHARNAGWRAGSAEWVVFLDDDVRLAPGWQADLASDLAAAGPAVAGVQGRITVPLPPGRPGTDWERNVAALEGARWATADMAYRRAALRSLGGFDPGFPGAFREDADLALRAFEAGWQLSVGGRRVLHPVRPADRLVSVRLQQNNAADARMRRRHGRRWRRSAGAPGAARLTLHACTTASLLAALGLALAGSRRAAALAALAWGGLSAEFAWRRIAPGPRTAEEISTMLLTTLCIPPAAIWHRCRGELAEGMRARRRAAGGR